MMKKNFLDKNILLSSMTKSGFSTSIIVGCAILLCIFSSTAAIAQSTFSGTGNWSAPARWSNGIPTSGTAATIANSANCTVDVAGVAASLTIAAGGTATIVTISGTNSLTISGAVTMNGGTGIGDNRTIAVGGGSLSAASITMTNPGNDNRDCIITLTTGTITISGNVTMLGSFARNHIDITNAGTINIGGDVSNGAGAVGGGFTNPFATSVINLNGSAAQTVFLYGGNSALGILKINNAAGVTSGSTLTTRTLTIGDETANSVFNDNGYQVTSTGTLNLTSGTFRLGSTNAATTFPAFTAGRNIASGTIVEYSSGQNQTVSTVPSYSYLVFSGNGTKATQAGTLVVDIDWTVGSTTALNTNNTVVSLTGNLYEAANITQGTGSITIGGNVTITAGTLTLANTVSIAGSTTVGDETDGFLVINNAAGTKTFTGLVTINPSGTWNNSANEAVTFRGGITNSGTFTAGTGVHTFDTNPQLLTGTLSIATVTVTGIVLTNTGTLTITTALTGDELINSNNATLNIDFTGTPGITTMTTTASGNTVNYGFAGTQTIRPQTYYNLGIATSGTKTLGNNTTVNNNLTIAGTAELASDIYTITGNTTGTFTMASGTSLTLGITTNTATTPFPTNFTAAHINLDAASLVTYQANADQTISTVPTYGNLTLTTGNAISNKTISGTLNIAGNLTVNNGAAAASLNFGATAATVNLAGNLSGTGTIAMTGTGLAHTLNLSGATNTIGTFSTTDNSGSTVNYNGSVDQQVFISTNYQNLTISNSGTKTLQGNTTVSGNIYITPTGTATLATSTYTLTGGSGSFSMDDGASFILGLTSSATAVPFPTFSGGYSFNSGSTVVYQANALETISALPTYGNLTITTGAIARTKTIASAITINGNLEANNGTAALTLSVSTGVTVNIAGNFSGNASTITLVGNSILNLGGNNTTTGAAFNTNTSTVNYNGSQIGQIVRGGITYYDLQISNGGTKLLQAGNATVSHVLTLNLGVFKLNDYNLLLTNTTTSAIAGSYSSASMIQTNGAGYLQKTGAAWNAGGGIGFNIIYPIGSGGFYNPLNLTSEFTATSGTGNIQIRAISVNQGPNALKKYWTLNITNYAGITTNLRFTYENAEAQGSRSSYIAWYYTGGTWAVAPGDTTTFGVNPFGTDLSDVTAASITGNWTAASSAPGSPTPTSYYSYQSGDWGDATSWTTDASGTLWQNPGVPSSIDNATILNGRTITANLNNHQVTSLVIQEGGILNINSTTGHNFGTVTGQGKLMLSSTTFPGGTYTNFVAGGGGTIEYFNLNNVYPTLFTYNNLIISNYSNSANTVYLNNSANPTTYTINGNFSLKNYSTGSQAFYFGNPTASDNLINMTVNGNFSVDAGCSVQVNNFLTTNQHTITSPNNSTTVYNLHKLYLYGNLTNNGTIRFTGLPSPAVTAYYLLQNTTYGGTVYGAVEVYFYGATNNTITCNGITDLFRLIVEKGVDKTYTLEVNSTNVNNFALYAPNYQGNSIFDGGTDQYGWGVYYKALYLHYGTLKLNQNINIPSLTEGGQDFNIIPTAELWIDGADVSTTVTGFNGTGYQAATLYGVLRVSAGSFSTGDAAGLVLGTLGTPIVRIEGTGILDVSQAWAAAGTNLMSYIQTGGTANFRMRGETHAGPMLGLSSTNASFVMSGGIMNFTDNYYVNNGGNDRNILDIQAQVGSYQVTGGTVNINLPSSDTVYTANSTAPFYNLNIMRRTGAGTVTLQWTTPNSNLTVLHDLNISNNTVLDLNTNSIDLNVGRNFTIASAGIYTPAVGAANVTTFNGTGNQSLYNIGTITGGFTNLTFSSTSVTSIINNNVTVNGTLTIGQNAAVNDSGRYINAYGNIVNSGTHFGWQTGGGIRVMGTLDQTISGAGTGTFNNLILDKPNTTGVTLTADISVSGRLRLISATNFVIGANKLTFGPSGRVYTDYGTGQSYGDTRMIATNGLASDRGIGKVYNAADSSFFYPIGAGTMYRPAKIEFTVDPTQYGTIVTRPVTTYNPLIQSSGDAINLYWKTLSSDFDGIVNGSVRHKYFYASTDAPDAGDEIGYIPAVYIIPSWVSINSVDSVFDALSPREIHFSGVNYIDGEFTCGLPAAFTGLLTFYSNSNKWNIITGADWNEDSTWCAGSNTGTPQPAVADDRSNAVFIIGDGTSNTHTIKITGSHVIQTGNILVKAGAVLDLGATTNHNFGSIPNTKVTGSGKLRIASTNYFPTGDWGDFLGTSGGTVEYYTTAASTLQIPSSYNLPVGGSAPITNYFDLVTLPYSGANIILPNTNLTVYNNFTVDYTAGGGTSNCITQVNANGSSTTLQVMGNLNIQPYGILQYMNNLAEYVLVDKDINIAANGALRVSTAGTAVANTLTVHGDIINNGTLDLNPAAALTRYCQLIFNGLLSKSVMNTTTPAATRFYGITVNKGSDRDSVVDIKISPTNFFMGSGGLTMQNGTFRLSTNVTMPLSTGAFTIPITGCLSANGGTFNIATSTTASADLSLIGRLEVLSGVVNVGPAISSTSTYSYNIVYATAGTPEITVTGGELNVYSQIRRGTINNSGSLNYTQTGGTVTVGGKNGSTTRSVFELLNIGSKFVMSSGKLVLATHLNASSPYDLYIEPDVQTVTGGEIKLGLTGVTTNGSLFSMLVASPLGDLTLDTTTNTCAIQEIYDLTLKGNLTIGGNTSYYNTNGLDVTIGGNLTNNNTTPASNGLNVGGYRPGVITQATTFNGPADQTIKGTSTPNRTNFACVEVLTAEGHSLYLSNTVTSNITTHGSLTLSSGTFNDGGNTIYVLGNIDNDAVHYSPNATTGGMQFSGTNNQGITGNGYGIFGNVEINNGGNGVDVTDNSTINGQLRFTNGYLYIDDYLLTLGVNATIAGTFNTTNLIQSNGVLSDEGVKKLFPEDDDYTFTFPVGANGKYTPCMFHFTANNNDAGATIKVVPVDALHPSVNPASYLNYLNYYWNVATTGFTTSYTVTHSYTFDPADVTGSPANIERCENAMSSWTTITPGTITSPTFSFSTSTYLDGGYTIGDMFASLAILYSIKSGSWSDPTLWAITPTGSTCNYIPDGNPAVIQAADSVALDANRAYAASVLVSGVLDAMNTTFHNIGVVSGNGKIKLRGTADGLFIFPGGSYDAFFTSAGSTIEFYGNTNCTLPSNIGDQYKPYQNVLLSGTGIKSFSSINLKVDGNLTFAPGSKLDNSSYNKDIYILGNWIDQNTTTAGFTAGTGTVRFTGTTAQRIIMANNSMKETFYNIEMNNAAGVIINIGIVDVSNQLILTKGNILTNNTNSLTLTSTTTNVIVGGSINSFVNGPLKKRINNGSSFQFPVGDTISSGRKRYGYITISNTVTSGAQVWTARFLDKDPTSDGYNIASVTEPLNFVVSNEYWNVIGPTGGAANVTLSWDQYTGMSSIPSERAQANVAEWNTPVASSWNGVGQTVTDFRQDSGWVGTSTQVSLENRIFTIGATGLKALIAAITSGLWSNTAIWSNGRVPGQNDTVVINNTIKITLNRVAAIAKLVVNTGGTFNDSTYALTISGDILLNGTWSGAGKITWSTTNDTLYGNGSMTGTSLLEISGSNKAIASTANLSLKRVSILTADTLYNSGTVTMDSLRGAAANSVFVNRAGSTLTINGPLLETGTLDAGTCVNTVIFNGSISQIIKPATYCNITLRGGGTKTISDGMALTNHGNVIQDTTDPVTNFVVGNSVVWQIDGGLVVGVGFENRGDITLGIDE